MGEKKVTAAELLSSLENDPNFIARRTKREEERRRLAEELGRAEKPVVEDLRSAGYTVDSVWDLVNSPNNYPAAIPILLHHLTRPYPDAIREGIARALAVPETRFQGWNVLKRLFCEDLSKRVKDGLAVAISGAADETVIDDVIALVRDRQLGASRVLLLSALKRSTDQRARDTLSELADDPDLKKEIRAIQRKKKRRRV